MLRAIALLTVAGFASVEVVAPRVVVISTAHGEATVPVRLYRGHPLLPAPMLTRGLPLSLGLDLERGQASVGLQGQIFQFPLGAPAFRFGDQVYPLVVGASVLGDTLHLPLQWLAEYLPKFQADRYSYDPGTGRFEEHQSESALAVAGRDAAPSAARRLGLRVRHIVTIDPGHGGRDPGNPGRFLPRGVNEKHINLAVAKKLEVELTRRGIDVIMTRMTDVYVPLFDRAPMCQAECDLFVSIHVNSMPAGRRQTVANGVETYFLAEAKTAEAKRVAEMENEALRFEPEQKLSGDDPLGFILRDLQMNEYLRESADLADLIQRHAAGGHPGRNRGVKQAGLAVLTSAQRPAVLVEMGFATNRTDARFLNSADGQRRLAAAIADGLVAYLIKYERKVGLAGAP